jgi:hypothetical protein
MESVYCAVKTESLNTIQATFHLPRLTSMIGFCGNWGRFFYASVSQVASEWSLSATKGRGKIRQLCKYSVCLAFLYVKQIITFCPASVSMLHGRLKLPTVTSDEQSLLLHCRTKYLS